MANNRMYLVNTATGQRVLIAKHLVTEWYFPATPEYPTTDGKPHPSWADRLEAAFVAELTSHGAGWGSTAWRVEYEHDEPEEDAKLKERCGR